MKPRRQPWSDTGRAPAGRARVAPLLFAALLLVAMAAAGGTLALITATAAQYGLYRVPVASWLVLGLAGLLLALLAGAGPALSQDAGAPALGWQIEIADPDGAYEPSLALDAIGKLLGCSTLLLLGGILFTCSTYSTARTSGSEVPYYIWIGGVVCGLIGIVYSLVRMSRLR